jgi:hypothetical protein
MKKVKSLSIPEPCHEDWDKMSKVEKGRFCSSCSKTVYDVSSFSDKKLINFIESNDDVCAQMLPSQIGRDLTPAENSSLLSRAAIAIGLISLTAAGNVYGQKTRGVVRANPPIVTEQQSEEVIHVKGDVSVGKFDIKKVKINIAGIVKNFSGNGLNEASIRINDGQVFNTDKLGRFKKTLEIEAKKLKITISKHGYHSEEYLLDPKDHLSLEYILSTAKLKGKVKKH